MLEQALELTARAATESGTLTCPLSGRPLTPWLFVPTDAMRETANPFSRVYWCQASGYGRVHPLPSPAECLKLYRMDGYYTHEDAPLERPAPRRTFADRVREHLAWRLDRGEPISAARVDALAPRAAQICDLGCGSGGLAGALAALGHRVVGVDPDPDAAAKSCPAIEFMAGSAEQLPAPLLDRKFDVVLLSHVLEHCIDPLRALENARGLLGPDGLFVCEVPNNAALALARAGCSWGMLDVPRHLHFFTDHSLVGFCQRAGLDVQAVRYGYYHRQFTNDWIALEGRLWDALRGASSEPLPPRNSRVRAWTLLLMSSLAPARFKYDSVQVVARLPKVTSSQRRRG